jgi:hypothetical protein
MVELAVLECGARQVGISMRFEFRCQHGIFSNPCEKPECIKERETWRERNRSLGHKFSRLKNGARGRGLSVSLTLTEFEQLQTQPCFYCGGPLPPTGFGLDRKDASRGYEIDNVVSCCRGCNERKAFLESAGFKWPRLLELMKELLPNGNIQPAKAVSAGE